MTPKRLRAIRTVLDFVTCAPLVKLTTNNAKLSELINEQWDKRASQFSLRLNSPEDIDIYVKAKL